MIFIRVIHMGLVSFFSVLVVWVMNLRVSIWGRPERTWRVEVMQRQRHPTLFKGQLPYKVRPSAP